MGLCIEESSVRPDLANLRYIFTERGVGYRFVDFKKEGAAAN